VAAVVITAVIAVEIQALSRVTIILLIRRKEMAPVGYPRHGTVRQTISSSDQVSRKALKNMYEEAVRTGNIPAAARSLRANVQAMLDEDKRLADAQAAAAEQRRLAAETERQRQAYDAAVKADAGAMAQAAAALKSADDARLAAENALQVARSRQASIGNLRYVDRTANY
jgi:hypothetical protein